MIGRTKSSWQRFAASQPGHRFQDRYRRRQDKERGWKDPRRLFYVLGGLIVALGSLAFGVLPGPGTLTFFVGIGMIAGEFRPVARLLDWGEVRAREFGRLVGRIWSSSMVGKVVVVSVGAICGVSSFGWHTSYSSADPKPYSPKCVEDIFSEVRDQVGGPG